MPTTRAKPAALKPRAHSDAFLRLALLDWFSVHGRAHLPWRKTRDPWRVLVSEFMLQQTQVERVIPKYSDFMKKWPTAAALARASLGDVLVAWSGLGYNRRAKQLWMAAQAVVAWPGGKVPLDLESLRLLPGVGQYTARAVLAFAANQDVALWDTNIRRIFARLLWGGEFAQMPPTEDDLEAALARALPRGRSRDWHGALMDFGSAVCTSRAPACGTCPLRKGCAAAPSFIEGIAPPNRLAPKQSKFRGSRREVRGTILKLLALEGEMTMADLAVRVAIELDDAGRDVAGVVLDLLKEGMVVRLEEGTISLP